MVSVSPWPLVGSFSLLSLVMNSYFFLDKSGYLMSLIYSLISLFLVVLQWWRDVIRESTYQGCHTSNVCRGIYFGMALFIISEVMFFFSFFFSFFFLFLNPEMDIGEQWPPIGIKVFSYLEVPLLNTLILLSSGVSITWMHLAIIESFFFESVVSGLLTVILGVVFSFFQYIEYNESFFCMSDSIYGSIYFIMTGFHGIHVIIGVMFISVELFRVLKNHFSKFHHLGFELSAWYWHFVDVVWLFLFVSIYWLGS